MDTYRVALIGCGPRGTAITAAYAAHPRTEVVAVCDLRPELADRLGERRGVTARFTDLDVMIRVTEPDIVIIATGTEFHYDLAMRVLAHGVHIDIEKPMTTDAGKADDVVALAQSQGRRIAVHHQGRVGSAMRSATKAVAEDRVGEIRYIYGSGKGYYGGYGLMNIGTHMIYDMMRFGGSCASVSAELLVGGRPARPEDVIESANGMGPICGENITAALRFSSGAMGTLLQHRFPAVDNTAYAMELFGTLGRIFWRTDGAYWLPIPHFVPGGDSDCWQPLTMITHSDHDPAACDEAEYWYVDEYVQALDEGRDHECSGAGAVHVIEIMMAIFESGVYGHRVTLPQSNRDHPLRQWRREEGLGDPPPVPRSYVTWLAHEDHRLALLKAEAEEEGPR